MRINDIGIQSTFGGEFEVKRLWDRDYLFLYFHTECFVELNGKTIEVIPPAAMIWHIGCEQHYYAKNDVYIDDYIHFLFDDSRSFIDELNLPVNTIIPLPENTVVPELLKKMYEEFVSINECREKSMECYFRLALMKISELSERNKQAKIPSRYDEMFRNLRSEIFLNPSLDWRVTDCANEYGLSTPYFQKLYKSFFGTTFVQDVVTSRIEHAKHFLMMSNYSIKEISDLCGYHNETFFMKQFKKNMKMTPSEFRKKEQN